MNTEYDKALKSFTLEGVRLTGVHSRISELFFPAYTYERARWGPEDDSIPKPATVIPANAGTGHAKGVKEPTRRTKGFRFKGVNSLQTQGMQLGKKVDREIARLCKLQPRNRERSIAKCSAHTRRILVGLERKSIGLDRAQVCVGSLVYRLGTAIDLVGVSLLKNDKLPVIVEVKVGWDKRYFKHTQHRMLPPFDDMADSPYHQHQIQLACNLALWCLSNYSHGGEGEKVERKMQELRAYVIRANSSGVLVYPLEERIRERIPEMLKVMAAHLNQRRGVVETDLTMEAAKVIHQRNSQVKTVVLEQEKRRKDAVKDKERAARKAARQVNSKVWKVVSNQRHQVKEAVAKKTKNAQVI